MQAWLDGKSCFSHTNASNFRRPLRSLLLRYTAENSQVTYFQYALSACANKIFQKRTVFVFTESWLRDQVMQRALERNRAKVRGWRKLFPNQIMFILKGILLPGTRWIRHWKRKQSKGCRPWSPLWQSSEFGRYDWKLSKFNNNNNNNNNKLELTYA